MRRDEEEDEEEKSSKKKKKRRPMRLHMPELGVSAMPLLEGEPGGSEKNSRKGGALCRSASPTRSFFHRTALNRPPSPHSAPARTSSSKMSPTSPKSIFPYQSGLAPHESPPKSPCRLSFSGIFRSSSRDSNHHLSSSPVSKLFTRNKRDKARGATMLEYWANSS
ncbi:5'-AMP-activated protein kinase subunit gamma-2-like [Cheilinus undulatus]|uniref:5'-AMP-activated protein kinase subunit gamma-2-like n=1 Tax=Cheilinus undulatus TaxID=241271 RepID=UPI001BD22F0A|nr:5'-AMP-activated protein kinase subunit gamma-2-like [Cheilinus undulatus]